MYPTCESVDGVQVVEIFLRYINLCGFFSNVNHMQYQRELISYDNIMEIPRKVGRIVSHPDIAKFLSCFLV